MQRRTLGTSGLEVSAIGLGRMPMSAFYGVRDIPEAEATLGRAIATGLGVPSLGVHHMEGHLLAPMLGDSPPEYPFVALLVSGGHTQLVRVDGLGVYALLGESLDDAAGEAFDKTAKMLDLPYPGGPHVARLAEQGRLYLLRVGHVQP